MVMAVRPLFSIPFLRKRCSSPLESNVPSTMIAELLFMGPPRVAPLCVLVERKGRFLAKPQRTQRKDLRLGLILE
jgi:hypothetical protein